MRSETIEAECTNCGSSSNWMVETHMAHLPNCGVVLLCAECYDGAPDAGMDIGRGDTIDEALADWQSQYYKTS